MPTNVDDIIKKLSPAQRKKVEARAAQLFAEEMTLRSLDLGILRKRSRATRRDFYNGKQATTPAHSSGSLHSAIRSSSSTASETSKLLPRTITPAIGLPV